MQSIILNLIGHYLKKNKDNLPDFEEHARLFEKGLNLMIEMFGENVSLYFRNIYLITMPNFFKNLVFLGGPWVKKYYFEIPDGNAFDLCINEFNEHFQKFGISVSKDDIREECIEKMNRLESEVARCKWLREW